jgi:hypothetical protein
MLILIDDNLGPKNRYFAPKSSSICVQAVMSVFVALQELEANLEIS